MILLDSTCPQSYSYSAETEADVLDWMMFSGFVHSFDSVQALFRVPKSGASYPATNHDEPAPIIVALLGVAVAGVVAAADRVV